MDFIFKVFLEAWHLLLDSSVYILFGLLIAGLLRVFMSANSVATHLGKGRFSSVFKAALLGISASPLFVRCPARSRWAEEAGGEQGGYRSLPDLHTRIGR